MTVKRAIVLAAGKGTRMNSELPKVLVPLLGRPIIAYVLEALRAAGISEILVVIGYRGEEVRNALAGYRDLVFVEQREQRGTGHAVMACQSELNGKSGPLFVIAGDSPLTRADSIETLLTKFTEFQPQKIACILGTVVKENPFGMGRIIRDQNGNFLDIVEEKDANESQKAIREINMSYYVFDTEKMLNALNDLTTENAQKEYYLTDLPKILLRQNETVLALPVLQPEESIGVNTIDDLRHAEEFLSSRK